MKKYVIRPGDTMYAISKKTGVRLPLLLAANPHITSASELQPGTTIVIPELGKPAKHQVVPPTVTHKAAPKPGQKKAVSPQYFGFVWPHVVSPNETIVQVTKRYGITMSDINMLNPGLNVNQPLRPGTVVYIPYMASPESKKAKKPQPFPEQQGDGEGPHSHSPYRSKKSQANVEYGVPADWDGDVDESSSLMSSWNVWDEATRSKRVKPKETWTSDGWSETLTVRTDEDA